MRKELILLIGLVFLVSSLGCAGLKPSPTKIQPVKVELTGVERLNATAAKPPFQPTDVLVFRVNFKLTNPNDVSAKVDSLNFELMAEDGTLEKTMLLASPMPATVIPAAGEIMWSWTEPYVFAAMRASYLYRGVGGQEGVQGVLKKVDEFWLDLGADKRKFFINGNITYSLPDFPNLGTAQEQFKTEFDIPKL